MSQSHAPPPTGPLPSAPRRSPTWGTSCCARPAASGSATSATRPRAQHPRASGPVGTAPWSTRCASTSRPTGSTASWTSGWRLPVASRSPSIRPEFLRLRRPADQGLELLVQRLDDTAGEVRAHLDIGCSDRAAETERHLALGATHVEAYDAWTVLADPTGSAYCITDRAATMTDPRIRPPPTPTGPRSGRSSRGSSPRGRPTRIPRSSPRSRRAGCGWSRRPGEAVVLEEVGELLGTAKYGPNRPGRGSHVGTASFMVAPAARGRGVGRALG